MNKYLLLRDNKQSGPYTVPEIIVKGIKPYDLVWIEGKSAAWRYPSEVDELKAFAPAVEEQPFDRFYKRPEPQNTPVVPIEKKSPFEPLIAPETVRKKMDPAPKKVYINFPGGPKKVPVYQQIKIEQPIVVPEPKAPVPVAEPPAADRRLLHTLIAACALLMIIISVLIINFGNQRGNIRQLDELVRKMEKTQNEQNQAAKAALATRVIPIPIQSSPQSLEPQTVVPASTSPAMRTGREKPVAQPEAPPVALPQTPSPIRVSQDVPFAAGKPVVPQPKETIKESLSDLVSVKPNKYKTGVLGGISNLQFILNNNSTHALQRVAVEVRYLTPEKKVVRTQTVYFEQVAPGKQSILDVPKSGRGISIDYSITDIKAGD